MGRLLDTSFPAYIFLRKESCNMEEKLQAVINAVADWFTAHTASEFNLAEILKSFLDTVIAALKG
jgi:hypothetical protein